MRNKYWGLARLWRFSIARWFITVSKTLLCQQLSNSSIFIKIQAVVIYYAKVLTMKHVSIAAFTVKYSGPLLSNVLPEIWEKLRAAMKERGWPGPLLANNSHWTLWLLLWQNNSSPKLRVPAHATKLCLAGLFLHLFCILGSLALTKVSTHWSVGGSLLGE